MSKRGTFLFLFSVIIAFSIFSILNKPTEEDFKKWLYNEHQIDCNEDCSIVELESVHGDITERIKYSDASGTYSPGLFTLRINRQYKSLNDPEQMITIDVIGFNGRFYPLHSEEEL
ncbi:MULTISPECIES: hypothetical protein [Bacillaceae]|uniref:hypothetical protein n=1 Tax=Bacillaceae TaxID=186817 RepID=UPI001C578817|nr:hypothetical protein [Rossellomorea sp. YZS02]MBW3113717.1 hypothetical protein [Bacillus sp. MCCB 382]MDX8343630.1 hypothetical protein [Rossellomorea sp. YZS02]